MARTAYRGGLSDSDEPIRFDAPQPRPTRQRLRKTDLSFDEDEETPDDGRAPKPAPRRPAEPEEAPPEEATIGENSWWQTVLSAAVVTRTRTVASVAALSVLAGIVLLMAFGGVEGPAFGGLVALLVVGPLATWLAVDYGLRWFLTIRLWVKFVGVLAGVGAMWAAYTVGATPALLGIICVMITAGASQLLVLDFLYARVNTGLLEEHTGPATEEDE